MYAGKTSTRAGPPRPGSEEAAGFAVAIASADHADKPVVATLLTGTRPAGVPAYPSVEEAVRALARVARYAQWRREPAGRLPILSIVDDDDPLVAYGIPVVRPAATGPGQGVTAGDMTPPQLAGLFNHHGAIYPAVWPVEGAVAASRHAVLVRSARVGGGREGMSGKPAARPTTASRGQIAKSEPAASPWWMT